MDSRKRKFYEAIARFIKERRDAKLKDAEAADSAQAAKYDYDTWLADAARRVAQIQMVTHVLKATHPDAKGSSLFVPPANLPARDELGSHVLGRQFAEDVVGNAAALDVYKLLKLEVEGQRLLDWLLQADTDLLAALSDNPDTARAYADAFCSLQREADSYASHTYAKQLYWCTGEDACDDAQYILLQPMFPSSLVQAVHEAIQYSRFDVAIVEARRARREKKPSDMQIPEYPELAIRKLGGTKPQNISQLNSERGGSNYLLASFPPIWDGYRPRSFLNLDTAFMRLLHFQDMQQQLEAFARHLGAYKQHQMQQDQKRRAMEQRLGGTLTAFAATVRDSYPPGWTRDAACRLPLCEQLWLDPERAQLPNRDQAQDPEGYAADETFKAAWEKQDWPDEIAERFAQWLNQWLRDNGFAVGSVELRHFARQAVVDANWPNPIRRDLPSSRDWHTEVSA
ncbi:type I-F CRISPR-associated protein Csy1 [Lysobacteraceae bacterium NML07-0707]|nr:type I-F CRISPR-associated protein Csy1 [Xanthomonadaceae bacterium NML07-0707]